MVSMVGEMLSCGIVNCIKNEIDEMVDFMGVSFFISSGGVYVIVLSKYKEIFIEFMVDVVFNLSFLEVEFEKLL